MYLKTIECALFNDFKTVSSTGFVLYRKIMSVNSLHDHASCLFFQTPILEGISPSSASLCNSLYKECHILGPDGG